jgi:hypothetical protein
MVEYSELNGSKRNQNLTNFKSLREYNSDMTSQSQIIELYIFE